MARRESKEPIHKIKQLIDTMRTFVGTITKLLKAKRPTIPMYAREMLSLVLMLIFAEANAEDGRTILHARLDAEWLATTTLSAKDRRA